jgi:hypothetical protein
MVRDCSGTPSRNRSLSMPSVAPSAPGTGRGYFRWAPTSPAPTFPRFTLPRVARGTISHPGGAWKRGLPTQVTGLSQGHFSRCIRVSSGKRAHI